MPLAMISPFLSPDLCTREGHLTSLHLRRDQALPTILSTHAVLVEEAGYAEGNVTNTRFGSFPHSTLIDLPWGSQVRASQVDTGTRGRKVPLVGKKRKSEAISRDGEDEADNITDALKEAVSASSGFLHVLPPTPENWTTSLPHRTQVVYTPDYSYILHRIRARPGSAVIEAGSGSGSFTHAAARAVFSGYGQPLGQEIEDDTNSILRGKVHSYEFHAERHKKVAEEMNEHGLSSIVTAMHRDVYNGGFLLGDPETTTRQSPMANAIFLDLPAPWLALPHLTREGTIESPSALDPSHAVYVCTFSPCIEQAQKTISALRRLGWLEIEMVEMQHKRIDVRREYTGMEYEGMRGVNAVAANVEEALDRLREVEQRAREFHTRERTTQETKKGMPPGRPQEAKKTLYKDGLLVHRSEPELKTHTSYLVFAILPRAWSEEDEERARGKWTGEVSVSAAPKSQRQMKKEAKQKKSQGNKMNGGRQEVQAVQADVHKKEE